MHAAKLSEGDRMKTNKAVITLLFTLALWLALVLGCSHLKKGTMTGGGLSPGAGSKDYFPLRVGDTWQYRSTTADGKQSEFSIKVLNEAMPEEPAHEWRFVALEGQRNDGRGDRRIK